MRVRLTLSGIEMIEAYVDTLLDLVNDCLSVSERPGSEGDLSEKREAPSVGGKVSSDGKVAGSKGVNLGEHVPRGSFVRR